MESSVTDQLALELNPERFLALLTKLISESKYVQNNPAQGLVPEEDRVGDHVLAALEPYTEAKGGPLRVKRVNFQEKRNNIIIEYPGTTDRVVSFVGSHMDVVPANPEEWQRDPFQLTIEGDFLYGRGTTDCLGHVALITDLMITLAEKRPKLALGVIAVFIANEENSEIPGIGVDELVKQGMLSKLKNGPLYWIDSADKQPCIGTGSAIGWEVTATGKNGHSGLPQNAINSMILAYEGTVEIMRRFHEDFPPHPLEKKYNYNCHSTMKMTMWSHPPGANNIIPGIASIQGDIRLTPFYKVKDVQDAILKYVADINANVTSLPTRGSVFKNELSDGTRGTIALKWVDDVYFGIACDLESPGYKALYDATTEVLGKCQPESLTGSLPCVAELQEAGFDVQICGYGVEAVYHGLNEYCKLSDMKEGARILGKVIATLDKQAAGKQA